MNVFDFDGTIMHGDTEDYFREYAYKHFKIKFWHKVEVAFFELLRKLKLIKYQTNRKHFYPYLPEIIKNNNFEEIMKNFWDEHEKDIFPYYKKIHQDDDLVVSATPDIFLLEIMRRLNISNLIASKIDVKTGKTIGVLCRAEQKVVKYNEVYHGQKFENYYFDSDHDMYLMEYSKNAFRVFDGELKKVK